MENTTTQQQTTSEIDGNIEQESQSGQKPKEEQLSGAAKIKDGIFEGARIGLLSFIICYGVFLVISLILNFAALDTIRAALLGTMGEDNATGFGAVIKLTSILLSISVFNSHGDIKVGVILLALVPLIAFYVVGNKERVKKGFTQWHLLIYFAAALTFAIVLTLLQLLTRGEFLGMKVSFLSFMNVVTTILVTLMLQVIIGLNQTKKASGYIRATRVLFKLVLGLGAIVALVDLIKMVMQLPIGFIGKMGAVVSVWPNLMIYKSFLFMGNNIDVSDTLAKLIDKVASIQLSFDSLSFLMSLVAIVTWIILVVFSLIYVNKNKYWAELGFFAVLFSTISTFLAFCTSTSFGEFILVGDISIGVNLFRAFLVPLVSILALGLMLWLIRKMIAIVKEI